MVRWQRRAHGAAQLGRRLFCVLLLGQARSSASGFVREVPGVWSLPDCVSVNEMLATCSSRRTATQRMRWRARRWCAWVRHSHTISLTGMGCCRSWASAVVGSDWLLLPLFLGVLMHSLVFFATLDATALARLAASAQQLLRAQSEIRFVSC